MSETAPGWKFLHEEIAALTARLVECEGKLVALQAKVYGDRHSRGFSEPSKEAVEARAAAVKLALETEVMVAASDWEKSWINW